MLDLLILLPTTDATVALEQLSYSVDEDDGIATVCAILTEGDLQKDISVQLTTSDITATGEIPPHTLSRAAYYALVMKFECSCGASWWSPWDPHFCPI